MRFDMYSGNLEADFVRRVRATYRMRSRRLAAIRTPDDARRYQERIRRALTKAFGPFPARTALNPVVHRVLQQPGFRVECLTLESRPGFRMTAKVYVTESPDRSMPGFLFPCGHSPSGKAHPLYVQTAMRLALAGYAVLIYDPLNQGERDLYAHLDTRQRLTRDNPCAGHNVIGRQLHLGGDWLGAWRLWDGIRCLDYLASRPEVDTARLAVTGQSGGGTLSAYLWAMEPRLKAVASSCWCTSYLNDIENGMPADDEQYPPGWLAAGMDKAEFFMVRAPEAALLLGQEQDFFDDRGLRGAYRELARLHALLGGREADCELAVDTGIHAYSESNQRAMLAFFNRVFGFPPPVERTMPAALTERDVRVTPSGDVGREGSRPIQALVADQIDRLDDARKPVPSEALSRVIVRALKVPVPRNVPHHRRLFHTSVTCAQTGRRIHRFAVETGERVLCVLRHICRDKHPFRLAPAPETLLVLPHADSQREMPAVVAAFGARDFWMLDARGMGESAVSPDDAARLYGHDYMAAGHALMYSESLLGARLGDVLATVRLLRAEGANTVGVAGWGQGAVLALLAGVLDPAITTVSAYDVPDSFSALATAPYTFWPASLFQHGVLKAFDLPDVRAALGARRVAETQHEATEDPWGENAAV